MNGPIEAQQLMDSFGFDARAEHTRDRKTLVILLSVAALVAVVALGFLWNSRAPAAPEVKAAPQIAPTAALPKPVVPEAAPPSEETPPSNPTPPQTATIVSPSPNSTVVSSDEKPAGALIPTLPATSATVAPQPVKLPAATVPVDRQIPVTRPPASPTPAAPSSSPDRDPYDALLAFYSVGDYTRALQECGKAIQKRPDGESTHLNCAAVHIQLGNLAEAVQELSIVTRLNDRNDKAFNNLGAVHMIRGENASAEAAFEKALLLNPANASAHLNRGLIARKAGKLDRAKSDFQAVLQLEERNVRAHQNLATIFEEQGELARALEHYRRFRELALGLPENRADVGRAETKIAELENRLRR